MWTSLYHLLKFSGAMESGWVILEFTQRMPGCAMIALVYDMLEGSKLKFIDNLERAEYRKMKVLKSFLRCNAASQSDQRQHEA